MYTQVRISRAKLFEFQYNDIANNIYRANNVGFSQARIDSFIRSNPPLLSDDKVLFNEYVEMVRSRRMALGVMDAKKLLREAEGLLRELEQTYAP